MPYTLCYNEDETPPAPIIELCLSNTSIEPKDLFQSIIDTGAATTLIPKDIADKLELYPTGDSTNITCADGRIVYNIPFYYMRVFIENYIDEIVEVIVLNNIKNILAGRNILKYLKILLDSPAMKLTILDKSFT